MLKITILVGEWERLEPRDESSLTFLIWDVSREWERRGHRVRVLRGPPTGVPGESESESPWDVCVLHVDLTRTPPEYLSFADTHRIVINGGFLDNSKRAVSQGLVVPGDGYRGPVIVKSDLNSGGTPERSRRRHRAGWIDRRLMSLEKRLPWAHRSSIPVRQYRVFESNSRVPRAVWKNPGLVVERFTPEYRDGLYWVRMWMFLGDQGYVRMLGSEHRVSKLDGMSGQQLHDQNDLAALPQAVRDRRVQMHMDYGKIDYVVSNGRAVVLDLNRTPFVQEEADERRRQAGLLADGLGAIVDPEPGVGQAEMATA